VAVAICSNNVFAAIDPTPILFTLPDSVSSLALTNNNSVMVASNSKASYSVRSFPTGMSLLTRTEHPGTIQCVVASSDQTSVSILAMAPRPVMFYHLLYRVSWNGNWTLTSRNDFRYDDSNLAICDSKISQMNDESGFFVVSQPSLYFLRTSVPTNATFTRLGPLDNISQWLASITSVPGTSSSQFSPPYLLATTDVGSNQESPVYQFGLIPKISPPKRIDLQNDEEYTQTVNLDTMNHDPSNGLLIVTLKNNAGIRVTPYSYSSMSPTGTSIIDRNTQRFTKYPSSSPIQSLRIGNCVYIIGQHPTSTVDVPVTTLTQWYINPTPQLIAQVSFKMASKRLGIMSIAGNAHGYMYVAVLHDQTIYRFDVQCP